MAPTIINTYGSTTGTVSVPNVQTGETLIVGNGLDYDTPGAPGGSGAGTFAEIGTQVGSPNSPTYANFALRTWLKIATGSGAYTVTGAGMLVVYHLSAAGDIDGVSGVATTQNDPNVINHVAGSVSPAGADDLLLGFWGGVQFGSTALTYTIASMTERQDIGPSGGYVRLMSASQVLAASGATGTRTAVASTPMTHGTASRLIAVRGTGGVVAPTGAEPGRFFLAVS